MRKFFSFSRKEIFLNIKKPLIVSLALAFFAFGVGAFATFPTAYAQPLALNWAFVSGSCNISAPFVEVVSGNSPSTQTHLCLWGSGYQGLGDPGGPGDQFNVIAVSGFHTPAWIRYYDSSGGHFCALNWSTGNFNDVKVTQVDIGTTGGYSYCP